MSTEPSQRVALHLNVVESERLTTELNQKPFLPSKEGIEVYMVRNGITVDVMVRAQDDFTCGMGVGYVIAAWERINDRALATEVYKLRSATVDALVAKPFFDEAVALQGRRDAFDEVLILLGVPVGGRP